MPPPESSSHGVGNGGAPPQHPGSAATRLDSWKDIAAHFRRDIRTVQLWEKKEGLPIYRQEHAGRATVYAYREELDAWLRDRSQLKPPPVAHEAVPTVPDAAATPPSRKSALLLLFGAIIVCTTTIAILYVRHMERTASQPPASLASGMLAVLPFEDLSAQAKSENEPTDFLADGLTDALITDLGRSGRLRVISGRSVMQFRGQHEPLPRYAAQLHATTVLEGAVAREGGAVRVTARLVDAAHDRQLWAATYSRPERDMMSLQDEIAGAIATAVTENLTGDTPGVNFEARPVNPQARIAYLTGRYLWNQRDEPDMRKAIDQFHQAIALDAGYAPAWSGLADSYNLMAVWGSMSAAEAFPQARAAAQQALALDPSSAEAWNSLAFEVYRYEWDFAGADADFRKAIAANPNYAIAHQWYGEFLGDLRRFDDSIAELRRAKDLDPLSAMVGCDLADGYFHAGRYAEATAEVNRILELYPNFIPAHSYLASISSAAGDTMQAEKEATLESRLNNDPLPARLMHIHAESVTGRQRQAREDVAALLATRAGAAMLPWEKAQIYFNVGELDQGYAALDQAYQEHSWWLVTLMVDPGFDVVRDQPRFITLEKRVGLPAGR
ncbi:MAG: hypothetical protein WA414_06170 [Acidobacteriaceae bacterium]